MQMYFKEKERVQHSTLIQKADFFQNINFLGHGIQVEERTGGVGRWMAGQDSSVFALEPSRNTLHQHIVKCDFKSIW